MIDPRRIGVPSLMCRSLTRRVVPSTPSTSRIDMPTGLGLTGEQMLKIPIFSLSERRPLGVCRRRSGENAGSLEVKYHDDPLPRPDVAEPLRVRSRDLQRSLHLGDAKVAGHLLDVRPHEPDGLHLDGHARRLLSCSKVLRIFNGGSSRSRGAIRGRVRRGDRRRRGSRPSGRRPLCVRRP